MSLPPKHMSRMVEWTLLKIESVSTLNGNKVGVAVGSHRRRNDSYGYRKSTNRFVWIVFPSRMFNSYFSARQADCGWRISKKSHNAMQSALRDSWMAFAHQSWVNQCHTRTQWRLVASDNTCNTNRKEEKYYSVYISGGVKKSTKIISQKSLSSHSIRENGDKTHIVSVE